MARQRTRGFLRAAWLVTAAGCASHPSAPPPSLGLDHGCGASQIESRVHYGIPILHKSFFWDGNGEVDNTGVGVRAYRFVADGVALGLGSNLVAWWTPGDDVYSAEAEGLLRIYPFHDLPVFADGNAGYQLANHQIPPGGTVWNFSFGFGAGIDVPLRHGTSLLLGTTYHHISNALGRENERNPSQNEARLWIGLGWNF